jgi:tetratricopeptide (TPR) repeat protein
MGSDAALAPLARTLIELTEGNPFFLEECVQTFVETKVLIGARGAYRLQRSLPVPQVPATVQAVLAARIDRLPPEDKRLLQCAAVVGKDVPVALLRSIAGMPAEVLDRGLASLQAAEFLYERSVGRDAEYTFKHGLTHEVAYGSLLQDHRRLLHAQILATLETAGSDASIEQVDRLAHHAVRGEIWDKGVRYLREAVARALGRSAHREAVTAAEQALAALAHLPESRERMERAVDLRFELRTALWPLGTMDRILTALHEAETVAEALADRRRTGLAAAYLCTSFYGLAAHDQAVAAGERARAHGDAVGDLDLRVLAGSNLGQAHMARTDYLLGTDILERTIALLDAESQHDRFGQGTLPAVLMRVNLVRGLAELGRFPDAIGRGEEAVHLAEAARHPASLVLAWWARSLPLVRRGDASQAIAALEHAVRVAGEAEVPIFLHWVGPSLGAAYTLAGRAEEAVTLLGRILAEDAAMNVASQSTLTTVYLAEAHWGAGRRADAMSHAERALALARERHEAGYEAWARRLLGEIAGDADAPDLDVAADAYAEALQIADELGMRPLAAHCHLGLGRLGREPATQAHLGQAVTMYREMEMTRWLRGIDAAM